MEKLKRSLIPKLEKDLFQTIVNADQKVYEPIKNMINPSNTQIANWVAAVVVGDKAYTREDVSKLLSNYHNLLVHAANIKHAFLYGTDDELLQANSRLIDFLIEDKEE